MSIYLLNFNREKGEEQNLPLIATPKKNTQDK
jgi:hypothetical protein